MRAGMGSGLGARTGLVARDVRDGSLFCGGGLQCFGTGGLSLCLFFHVETRISWCVVFLVQVSEFYCSVFTPWQSHDNLS